MRTWCTVAAGVVAAAVILAACGQGNQYVAPPLPKVGVAKPAKQPITRYLEATGSTAAVNSADLVARVNGFIETINYEDGAPVKKGDLLFTIELEPYKVKLEQAKASETSAVSSFNQAQAAFDRSAELLKNKVTTQASYDSALATRDAAQSTLDNARSNTRLAADQLRLCTGAGAVRRRGDGAQGLGRDLCRRQRHAHGARHHRAARSDLGELQHQRAGCHPCARGAGGARRHPRRRHEVQDRSRAAGRDRLSACRSHRLRRADLEHDDRHAGSARRPAESEERAAAGIFRAHPRAAADRGGRAAGARRRARQRPGRTLRAGGRTTTTWSSSARSRSGRWSATCG